MVNKTKILSELSKIVLEAMNTLSGLKKEIETIVKIRVEKAINKMNLVRRDEFEVLKKIVQKLAKERKDLRTQSKRKGLKSRKKKVSASLINLIPKFESFSKITTSDE